MATAWAAGLARFERRQRFHQGLNDGQGPGFVGELEGIGAPAPSSRAWTSASSSQAFNSRIAWRIAQAAVMSESPRADIREALRRDPPAFRSRSPPRGALRGRRRGAGGQPGEEASVPSDPGVSCGLDANLDLLVREHRADRLAGLGRVDGVEGPERCSRPSTGSPCLSQVVKEAHLTRSEPGQGCVAASRADSACGMIECSQPCGGIVALGPWAFSTRSRPFVGQMIETPGPRAIGEPAIERPIDEPETCPVGGDRE